MNRPDKNTVDVVVIGAARSGVAAASLLKKTGYNVFVSDHGAVKNHIKQQLDNEEIPYEENGHTERAESGTFAVVSPGVPSNAPIVQEYQKRGKNVISELELAWQHASGTVYAVTGTNGKTTVTNWLDFVWNRASKKHSTAGNIGYAFSHVALETTDQADLLLEVSSFQLDHIRTFRPHAAILLNITPDHLDRYAHSFEKYAAAKFRIFEHQSSGDWLIYNHDDPVITSRIKKLRERKKAPKLLPFSTEQELPKGAYVKDGMINITINNNSEELMYTSEIGLAGSHNLSNGLAVALAAKVAQISNEVIRESLKRFEGVEHRLEFVRELDGVRYINDSKATNINAAWYALDSLKTPGVLILGGRDKGNDYTTLHKLIYEKIHTVIAIGESRDKILDQVGRVVPDIYRAETMEEAVQKAHDVAHSGDIVLLSTACSSFDMFDNYEHRGNVFKKLVHQLH